MKRLLTFLIVIIMLFVYIPAFSEDIPSIAFEADTYQVSIGKSINVKTNIAPKANMKLEWSSSDDGIAEVSAKGIVKGVSNGTAIITVNSVDNPSIQASCTVIVVVPVNKIIISDKKVDLAIGVYHQLSASVEPYNASTPSVSWSSSNEKVAIVDNAGKVTGLNKGTAKITATANDGSGIKASVTIKVEEYALVFTSKRPQKVKYQIIGGGNYSIKGLVKNGNVSIPNIDEKGWRSSGNSTEAVEVTPLKPGTDTVTIKFNNKKLEYPIFVADYFMENEIQYVPVPDTSPNTSNSSFREIVYGTPYSEIKDKLVEVYGNNYIINESQTGVTIVFSNPKTNVAGHNVMSIAFSFVYDEDANGYINKDESTTNFYGAEYRFSKGKDDSIAKDLYSKLNDLYGQSHRTFEDNNSWDWYDDNQTSITLYNGYSTFGVMASYVWSPGRSKSYTLLATLKYLKEVEEQKQKESMLDVFDTTTDGL